MSHYHESGAYARTPAWHGLGHVAKDYMNLEDAIRLAELDWPVQMVDLFRRGDINPATGNATPEKLEDYKGLVRHKNGKSELLAVHGSGYTPLQNREAFEIVNRLMGMGAQFETAGAVKGGKIVYCQARMPENYKVLGDEFQQRFVLLNSHDGSLALCGGPCETRVVCWNTVQFARQEIMTKRRNVFSRIKHTTNMNQHIKRAEKIWLETLANRERLQKQAEYLQKIKFTEKKYLGLVKDLMPMKDDPTAREKANVTEKRSQLYKALGREDLENFGRSGWAFCNAVADFVDHAQPLKKTKNFEENRYIKVVQGHELLQNAVGLVIARS